MSTVPSTPGLIWFTACCSTTRDITRRSTLPRSARVSTMIRYQIAMKTLYVIYSLVSAASNVTKCLTTYFVISNRGVERVKVAFKFR